MKKYYAVLHRPTNRYVSVYSTGSIYGESSFSATDFPRIWEKPGNARNSINNGTFWGDDGLLFKLGLEVVEIIPSFEVGESKFQQVFAADKL